MEPLSNSAKGIDDSMYIEPWYKDLPSKAPPPAPLVHPSIARLVAGVPQTLIERNPPEFHKAKFKGERSRLKF